MSNEQREALAKRVPTTEVIRDAVTFPRDRLGEPLDISAGRFEAWLNSVKAQVLRDAAIELESVRSDLLSGRRKIEFQVFLATRADRIEKGE